MKGQGISNLSTFTLPVERIALLEICSNWGEPIRIQLIYHCLIVRKSALETCKIKYAIRHMASEFVIRDLPNCRVALPCSLLIFVKSMNCGANHKTHSIR